MHEWAPRIDHVSGERIGGGLAADGMGELSKLLLGAHPAKALRLARDTGVLVHVLPEFAPAIGYDQQSGFQHLPLDEHIFAVVQAAADAGARWGSGSRRCCTTSASPRRSGTAATTRRSAQRQPRARSRRLRYPSRLRAYVVRLVREHPFPLADDPQPVDARRFLARHGERLALDLLAHRAADLAGKTRARGRSGAARALPRARRAGAGRSRTGSPTWRWTAPT